VRDARRRHAAEDRQSNPDYAKVPLIEPARLGADLLPARLGFVA
jgi:hypothetical protein